MYRVRGVIPPGLPVLNPPNSVYVCGEAGDRRVGLHRTRDHRGRGCNVRLLGVNKEHTGPHRPTVRIMRRGGSKPANPLREPQCVDYGTGGLAGVVSWVGMELLVGSG